MRRAVVFTLAAALAACAGPRRAAPPDATVIAPAAWRNGTNGNGEITVAWWQGFADPTLTALVEKALGSNVDIALAATRVEEARAQFSGARSQLLPHAQLLVAGRRERFLSAFGDPVYQTAERAEIAISYDLDLFGRLRNASEAARVALLPSCSTSAVASGRFQ